MKARVQVVAAVIEDEGRYLITQRGKHAVLANKWEFPGGRVEEDESLEEALVRELRERLGIEIIVQEKLGENTHEYTDYCVEMHMFSCQIPEGVCPMIVGVQDLRWVFSEDMSSYDFPPADETSMSLLLGLEPN